MRGATLRGAALERELTVPVELYDERFTTRLAERVGGKADEDSRAAAHLLEGWLASQQGFKADETDEADETDDADDTDDTDDTDVGDG